MRHGAVFKAKATAERAPRNILPVAGYISSKRGLSDATEGRPADQFLAVLAEFELAGRDMRRIRRHLTEARLSAGKTLATFDFKALPSLTHPGRSPRCR